MIQKKFRVWDGKKYHYPEATKEEANHYLQFGSEGFWLYNAQGKMITATEVGGICEQFTGHRDKEKKEIWENDIVELEAYVQAEGTPWDPEGDEYHYTYTGVVKYTPSQGFHLRIFRQYDEISGELTVHARIKNIVQSRCKLLGNIHENPELLTVK